MRPALPLALLLAALLGAAAAADFNCSGNVCDPVITPCCDDPDGNCPGNECSKSQLRVISPFAACGCCASCIDYLAEGDACTTSNVYNIGDLPSQLCGSGLACTQEADGAYCRTIASTECAAAQAQYDANDDSMLIPGQLRPLCDSMGLYKPAQRVPGLTTSCYSKDGRRIFGERGSTQDENMECQCSRLYEGEVSVEGLDVWPHCLSDGSFDTLQCNEVLCFCVNEKNGTITSPSIRRYPDFVDLLDCFNSTIHRTDYLKPCELAAQQLANETELWAKQGYTLVGNDPPACDIGGYFDKVQETSTERYCVAPDGTDLGYHVSRRSAQAANMTCNCARSAYHMQAAGQRTDLPQCCTNGDFRSYQCRGLYCYCVDVDGIQTDDPPGAVTQSSVNLLPCSKNVCPTDRGGAAIF